MGRFGKCCFLAHALATVALAGSAHAAARAGDEVGWGSGDPAAETGLVVELVEDGQTSDAAYGGASRQHPLELVLQRRSLSAAEDSVVGARKVYVWARALNAPGGNTGLITLAVDLADAKVTGDGRVRVGTSGVPVYSRRELSRVLALQPDEPQLVPLDDGAPNGVPARALRVEMPSRKVGAGGETASR